MNRMENEPLLKNSPNFRIRRLTYGSLSIALVLLATYLIKIPVPFTQGYIHPGDSMIFLTGILFGWPFGALAGGIGSAMADLFGGYAHWALPTLIIKTVMGGLVGWVGYDLPQKNHWKGLNSLLIALGITLWVAFNLGIKELLNKALFSEQAEILSQSLGKSQGELLSLSEKVSFSLTLAAIAIPLGLLILSFYLKRKNNDLFAFPALLAMFLAGLWMITGYYLAGGIIYGSFLVPILSIPANIVQFLGGLGIAYLILIPIRRGKIFEFLNLYQ